MKEPIFNQIAENVCSIYDISKEKLFTKTKERKVVDARHLLYYGCYDRQIRLTYIQVISLNHFIKLCMAES